MASETNTAQRLVVVANRLPFTLKHEGEEWRGGRGSAARGAARAEGGGASGEPVLSTMPPELAFDAPGDPHGSAVTGLTEGSRNRPLGTVLS